MRPPPPPQTADLYYPHLQQPPPRQPGPRQALCLSNQSQLHPHNRPPPHQNQFRPPPPHHLHSQIHNGFSQEWSNALWGHRQAYSGASEYSNNSTPFPTIPNQEMLYLAQSAISAFGSSTLGNQPFLYGNQSADLQPRLNYQPLGFAPRFNRSHDPHMQASYFQSNVALMQQSIMAMLHSLRTRPSTVPQLHTSVATPFPVPEHLRSISHQSVPSAGTPYFLGAGNALHASTDVPSNSYEILGFFPKRTRKRGKGRTKKKAVKSSSFQEHLAKGIGEEDHVEAARTDAINLKIENLLTEVISKVTDELYDEIATRVVNEDNPMVNEVLIPNQAKSTDTVTLNVKSNYSSSGQEHNNYKRNDHTNDKGGGKSSESKKRRKLQF